jgi:hypothetical protein
MRVVAFARRAKSESSAAEKEAAEIINRFLLEPLEKKPLTISINDVTWRNTIKISGRLDLCSYLLQEITDGDNPFQKGLSTTP